MNQRDLQNRKTLWDSTMGVAATLVLWPLIVSVPLMLQHTYANIFKSGWYAYQQTSRIVPRTLSRSGWADVCIVLPVRQVDEIKVCGQIGARAAERISPL